MPATREEIILILSIISIFIVVMVTFIVIILFFIQKKQKGFASDLNAVKANYDKELYKVQLEIQEQTFQEIAREIHDNVGQLLSLARLGVNALDFENAPEAKTSAAGIADMIGKALEDLRHMSRSLNADFIKKRGLVKSIETQVEFLQRNDTFTIRLHVIGEYARLDETKEVILFRIMQEAVNNIIRHATASEIDITLSYGKEILILYIQDNGKGFNTREVLGHNGESNGIQNMQHRAKLIEAEFQIDSKTGTGTRIVVTTAF